MWHGWSLIVCRAMSSKNEKSESKASLLPKGNKQGMMLSLAFSEYFLMAHRRYQAQGRQEAGQPIRRRQVDQQRR